MRTYPPLRIYAYISCLTCPSLAEHATNKHSKTVAQCFPGFVSTAK